MRSLPTINIPTKVVHLLNNDDETTLTHHSLPKFIIYMRVSSWCCAYHGFWQMCSDMYLSLWTEEFHCPKNPLCATSSTLSYWFSIIPESSSTHFSKHFQSSRCVSLALVFSVHVEANVPCRHRDPVWELSLGVCEGNQDLPGNYCACNSPHQWQEGGGG